MIKIAVDEFTMEAPMLMTMEIITLLQAARCPPTVLFGTRDLLPAALARPQLNRSI